MKKSTFNASKLSDGILESKTHSIISSMTGNANFPTPTPSLAELEMAADNFSSALVKAGTGNRADVADKNAKRQVLVDLLVSMGMYVTFAANGDVAALLSSGFEISKDRQPAVITKPEIVRVENGLSSGQLLLNVKAVKGAHSYLHEYTTDATLAPASWVSTTSTTAKGVLSNLQPGTVYYCRVAAVGANNQLLYSDPVSRMVL